MGNWHISIEGVGAHHNSDHFNDANRMSKRFVKQLQKAGHTVTRATFTHGGAENLGGTNNAVDMRYSSSPDDPVEEEK
jgi:hypothetical protein